MDIRTEQKATVFSLKENEKMKKAMMANLSTYEGKDKDDKVKYSSWNTNFVGDAFEKSKSLKDKDRIILTKAKIENTYVKEKDTAYYNLTVFDFEMDEKDDKENDAAENKEEG